MLNQLIVNQPTIEVEPVSAGCCRFNPGCNVFECAGEDLFRPLTELVAKLLTVDPVCRAQPQIKSFTHGLGRGKFFQQYGWVAPGFKLALIVFKIGWNFIAQSVARSVETMSAGPCCQAGFALPIAQIVTTAITGPGKIGYFIVFVACVT